MATSSPEDNLTLIINIITYIVIPVTSLIAFVAMMKLLHGCIKDYYEVQQGVMARNQVAPLLPAPLAPLPQTPCEKLFISTKKALFSLYNFCCRTTTTTTTNTINPRD